MNPVDKFFIFGFILAIIAAFLAVGMYNNECTAQIAQKIYLAVRKGYSGIGDVHAVAESEYGRRIENKEFEKALRYAMSNKWVKKTSHNQLATY